MSFEEAVRRAIQEIVQNQIISRWCDSSGGKVCDIKFQDNISSAILTDKRSCDFEPLPPALVFKSVISIGGESGWFTYHFLWSIRGLLDKLVGGYGLNRGRRQNKELRVGDALDFWKVADIKKGKRLLLLAQMKLPGKAWLEFDIQDQTLVQTAYFYPRGVWGRLYWYSVLPLHNLVFQDLAKKIITQARSSASSLPEQHK